MKPGDYGVTIFRGHNPLSEKCANCPFRDDGAGVQLHPDRYEGILFATTMGQPFYCHKIVFGSKRTHWETNAEGHEQPHFGRHWRQCKGAIEKAEQIAKERGIEVRYIPENSDG